MPPAKRPGLAATESMGPLEQPPRPSTSTGPTPARPAVEAPASAGPAPSTSTASSLPEGMGKVMWPERWSSKGADYFDRGGQYQDTYRYAFDAQTPAERFALRNWTHVDGTEERYVDYVDGQAVTDTNVYVEENYALNSYLRGGAFDPRYEQASDVLHNALSKLPEIPEKVPLLRVADVDANYGDRFKVGDYVTNGRLFMSASSKNDYAVTSFQQGYAAEGRTGGMAIYEINAKTARPMLEGITTHAGHEAESVALPNTVYRVEALVNFTRDTQSSTGLPVTAMRLEEVTVSAPMIVKNIHTGEPVTIGPEEQQPPPLPTGSDASGGSSPAYDWSGSD